MAQRNLLPALNTASHHRNDVHVVKLPQATQIKRARRFNLIHQIANVQKNEQPNTKVNLNSQSIAISPPCDPLDKNKSNPRFRRQNDIGFIIGYRGEAYVYKMLLDNKKFETVIWNALSNDHNNPYVTTVDGSTYYIREDGLPYDLFAIDEDGDKYYFEVKSTSSKDKDVTISRCQANLAKKLSNSNEHHIVAVVFNVNEDPSVIYYKKMNDLK